MDNIHTDVLALIIIGAYAATLTVYSENAWLYAKWQWNVRDCVTGLHDWRSRGFNSVTQVEFGNLVASYKNNDAVKINTTVHDLVVIYSHNHKYSTVFLGMIKCIFKWHVSHINCVGSLVEQTFLLLFYYCSPLIWQTGKVDISEM